MSADSDYPLLPHHGLIVTFHAFKGGTGRTLALANVARLLADEMGYRVGLVDLDVDSPGLVHEPLCESLEPCNAAVRDALLEEIDEQPGFLEAFNELADAHSREQPLSLLTIDMDRRSRVLSSDHGGTLVLVPTARGSVTKTDDYTGTVRAFNQRLGKIVSERDVSVSASDDPAADAATNITWHILQTLMGRYQLDYLFIDGRTGAGPFSPVYTYSIPHLLVLFFGLNDQNVLGSLSILRKRLEEPARPVPVLLVASPVPTVGPQELEQRLAFIARELHRNRKAGQGNHLAYELSATVDHLLPYSDAAAFGETYFPGIYPNSLLTRAYRRLANDIEALEATSGDRTEERPGLLMRDCSERRPITIAIENVHEDLLKAQWGPDSGFEFHSYPAESDEAPWEQMLNCDSAGRFARLRAQLPDVMMVPQSRIEAINAAPARWQDESGPLLWDLTQLRHTEVAARAMHFNFVDTYYGNWRTWCSVRQHVMALPFSVNATLLCANEKLLEPICATYWQQRSQEPTNPFFMPSSWSSLLGLLQSAQRTANGRSVYSIVRRDRGLYYEWLNCVAAFGGFDFLQGEGGLIEDVKIDSAETIEATRLFVSLTALCGSSAWMDEQIRRFASRDLALYTGWTDSFRFGRTPDGTLSSVYPTSLQGSEWEASDLHATSSIRLGRCPRDMRQTRTCLVDGWLMTFPRKQQPGLEPVGLRFANAFLDPQVQRKLLLQGFPTASRWAVEQEIAALKFRQPPHAAVLTPAERMSSRVRSSFEVFLTTLLAAMSYGRWVASVDDLTWSGIVGTLHHLMVNPALSVAAELRSLGSELRSRLRLSG